MAYEALKQLPDPTTVPAGPGFLSAGLTDNTTGLVHSLNNGASVAVQYAGNFWTITIGYYALNPTEASTLIPFLNSVAGGFTNFYVQLPMFVNPKTGAWDQSTSTKRAEGRISIVSNSGDKQIQITSWNTAGGNISAGDMIKFTNSNKIYQVVSANLVSTTMTLELHCPIIERDKVSTAGLEPNGIKFRVRHEGTSIATSYQNNGLLEPFSITLRENIL